MRGASAHIKVLDRRTIVGPARHRSEEEQLLQRKLSLKDIPLGQSPLALEIKRSHNLSPDDDVFEIRGELAQRVYHHISECLLLLIPITAGEMVRRVLDKARHHMFPRRRHGRIGKTR